MGRREIINGVAGFVGASGVAALIAMMTLPGGSIFIEPLVVSGAAAIVVAIALWVTLWLTTKSPDNRNPDALYQGGVIVAYVQGSVERVFAGEIQFSAIQDTGRLNPNEPVEYRTFVLKLSTSQSVNRSRFGSPTNMIRTVMGVTTATIIRRR